MYIDYSGTIRNSVLGDHYIVPDMFFMSNGSGGGGAVTSSRTAAVNASENKSAFLSNTDPNVVLDAENVAFYNGAMVIKVPAMNDSAFSFGIILMGPNVTSSELVKHEWGHTNQLAELGFWGYASFVVAPSVACYWMTERGALPGSIYHSLPWEYKANEYGQATFPFTSWAETVSDIYWTCVKIISHALYR